MTILLRAPVLAATLALAAFPAAADPLIDRAFDIARAECAEMGGTLRLPDPILVAEADLTGDGTADDRIVSEAGAFCGPDLGYLGAGSAGARQHAIIGDLVQELWPGSWGVADVALTAEGERLPPRRVLLLGVHGSACDSFGASPCLLAMAWDGTRLISVADGFEALMAAED